MKIAIIGYSGSGKSTLAEKLGKKYNIEALYLDTVHWLPGWKERGREEEIDIVGEFLDSHNGWVIDGNYSKVYFERRMEEADMIIFMCFNRFSSLMKAVKRYKKYKGQTRESMTAGCPEKIDFHFVKWILWDGRRKKVCGKYKATVKKYAEKSFVIKNQKQLDGFYQKHRLIY